MAREPHYPDDAPVGDTRKAARTAPRRSASPEGQAPADAKADEKSGRTKQIVTGAAIGIGSAAIVAALLYANRRGRNDKA
ncbi:hypothetical protein E2493_00985 [Sphingomonas parva]|uniref:Uncharacterized protein n=1 Tax=Sphingomonas parva TaxID=2555898 RepID=A0A4Y8ZYA8_9SPHN|nr:hypothetical protein [Sphingomonas parva]TFI60315.1 hypothetical protein E2493_00985 [Sphingomonas parva]